MNDQPMRLLVVDDDSIVVESLADFLSASGYECATAASAEEAEELISRSKMHHTGDIQGPFAVIIVDMCLPGSDGLELIRNLREQGSDIVPIAMTGYGTIESAVSAIRLGAIDYLIKPIVDEELLVAVEKAIQQHVLVSENTNLRQQLESRYGLDNIVGHDPRMQRIYEVIEAVAPTKTTVLMTGESGTGKSLIARAVHRKSPRADEPFIEISCGSIPETLLESELFGHVKGAFTGAHADKVGRFLAAHGGTIFLDEINSASPAMQLKLLRVLQEKKFEPVGSTETIEVDVRVLLASNQPLEELVASGDFRQDLYYRINVVMIQVPPLRDRVSDISILADHFLAKYAKEAGKEILGITEEAMNTLKSYSYPGNIRELENLMERAVVLTKSQLIQRNDLPPTVLDNNPHPLLSGSIVKGDAGWNSENWNPMPLTEALKEPEKQIILAALQANNWNRQKTADDLDINRTTLYKKIKQYGLEKLGRTG